MIVTNLFGADFPDWFGSLWRSMFSLFQIMTLESWSMGIVRPVMEVHAFAWLFFVPFILMTTFVVLNLFIAVIVNAMQSQHEQDEAEANAELAAEAHDEREAILAELKGLRSEVQALKGLVAANAARGPEAQAGLAKD